MNTLVTFQYWSSKTNGDLFWSRHFRWDKLFFGVTGHWNWWSTGHWFHRGSLVAGYWWPGCVLVTIPV